MIGCTILRAVSGILRTHRGRRGSGPGRLPVGATIAGQPGPAGSGASPLAFALACAASLPAVRITTCLCGVPPDQCGFALLLSARVACLSHLVGVGHCSLAIGHGPSAGLLVCVLDRRLVSPLSSSRACSGAGSGWHCCGWITVSAVLLLEGLAPWCRPRACVLFTGPSPWWRIASGARLRRSWGRPTERGLSAGQLHCGSALSQVAASPIRAPGAWGQVGRKFEPGAALGGQIQPASGQLTHGRWRCSRTSPQATAIGNGPPGGRGLGAGAGKAGIPGRSRPALHPGHGADPACAEHGCLARAG
jgi:hypothetical protein